MYTHTKLMNISIRCSWESPGILWLGLSALTAVGLGLVPGQGTKIPQETEWQEKKKKKKKKPKKTINKKTPVKYHMFLS